MSRSAKSASRSLKACNFFVLPLPSGSPPGFMANASHTPSFGARRCYSWARFWPCVPSLSPRQRQLRIFSFFERLHLPHELDEVCAVTIHICACSLLRPVDYLLERSVSFV